MGYNNIYIENGKITMLRNILGIKQSFIEEDCPKFEVILFNLKDSNKLVKLFGYLHESYLKLIVNNIEDVNQLLKIDGSIIEAIIPFNRKINKKNVPMSVEIHKLKILGNIESNSFEISVNNSLNINKCILSCDILPAFDNSNNINILYDLKMEE